MIEEKKHGGARPGSGRPSTDRKVALSVRISQVAAELLDKQRNKSEYIDCLIREKAKEV